MAEQRRIGYWLKELDRLITARFEDDLAAGGLSRRYWQMLHSLADGPQPAETVRAGLAPFWTGPQEWEAELAAVLKQGWVAAEDNTLQLTDAGRATHDEAFIRIAKRRRAMVDGISDEQYLETVRVLEKMATNMAGAEG